jgi:hypothetical protein
MITLELRKKAQALVPRYMSQELFNVLAIKLAWVRRLSVYDHGRRALAIDETLQRYRQFYAWDRFESELWHAADALDQWLADAYPNPPEQMAWMNVLRGALEKFEPDGAHKRRPLINSLWYTSARSAPEDRPKQCMRDVAHCHASIQVGRIPR